LRNLNTVRQKNGEGILEDVQVLRLSYNLAISWSFDEILDPNSPVTRAVPVARILMCQTPLVVDALLNDVFGAT
jgi:hypothetical protein